MVAAWTFFEKEGGGLGYESVSGSAAGARFRGFAGFLSHLSRGITDPAARAPPPVREVVAAAPHGMHGMPTYVSR